ncbi:gluconokinase [Thalassospira sp.]|uniref:gluconokinase n=1 Tax=Thalassospira sp. TaxID=1912094 RepID=UPI00273553AB|nr:gluconokinase [Thalassospira sp.]MDP2699699.1 gluconokinase [Thalassospira sp.]
MTIKAGFVIVMGVSGSGKTEIARRLAERTGGAWLDADDHHPLENVEYMRRGLPLNDEMRWPWLGALCIAAQDIRTEAPVFMACSALKRRYRDFLRNRLAPVCFVFLEGSRDLILARLERRTGHFMPSSLLDSQLGDLEPPGPDEDPLTVSIDAPIETIVNTALAGLAVHQQGGPVTSGPTPAGKPAHQGENK